MPGLSVLTFTIGNCSLGKLLLAASRQGICAVLLGDDDNSLLSELHTRFPLASISAADTSLAPWLNQIIEQIENPKSKLDLPLHVRGTTFQQRVWQALQEIPAGHTLSYTDLATKIGQPKAARAVASACANNTIAILIPCHRIVRSDGTLSGYRWGVERKRQLLEREAQP